MIFTLFYIQIFIHILYSPHSIHPPVPSFVFFLGVPGSMLYIRLFFLLVAAHVCMYIRRACHMIYILLYVYIYIYKHPKNRKVVHHYFSRICIYIYIIQFFLLKPWVYIYIYTLYASLFASDSLGKARKTPQESLWCFWSSERVSWPSPTDDFLGEWVSYGGFL